MQVGGSFPLFHYEIGRFLDHYLPNYSHSKQPNNIFSFHLHLLCCSSNTNVNLCQLDSTLTCELTTFYKACTKCKKTPKYNDRARYNGTFRADSKQMRAVDRKQRIYLEWPYSTYKLLLKCPKEEN